MRDDAADMRPESVASVTACHGLLSQVFDDVTLHHACSFMYSPTVIQRKLFAVFALLNCLNLNLLSGAATE